RIDREEKLKKIKKEIAKLHQHCDSVQSLMKTIERLEKEMDELASLPCTEATPKPIEKEAVKKTRKKKVKPVNEV
ncbi:hypothetical protein PENTCL1PPCAC_23874, partial [Pristionchus entomophagus]